MKYGKLIIDKREFDLLKIIIQSAPHKNDNAYVNSLNIFSKELKEAERMISDKIPLDVVRLNSKVTVQGPVGNAHEYTVVLPEKSNIQEKKISILAPMAMALFGYSQGDEIEWPFPGGIQTLKIINVTH